MISISSDVRKVQKSCYSANVNVDGKHLKQIKKIIQQSIQTTGLWHVADEEIGQKWKKRLGRGSRWKENGGYFSYSYDRVGGAGRFLVSLSPVKVNIVAYLG